MTDAIQKVTDTVKEHNPGVPFYTLVDVAQATEEMLENFRPYIAHGRAITPAIAFYIGDSKAIQVVCRQANSDDAADVVTALEEAMFLWPATHSRTVVLGFQNNVMVLGRGIVPCIVVSVITRKGIYSKVFPFEVENGEAVYYSDCQIEGQPEPTEFKHLLAVFGWTNTAPASVDHTVRWLNSLGHEIQTFGDWNVLNIQSRSGF